MIDIKYDISCYKPYIDNINNPDASSYFIPKDNDNNVGFIIDPDITYLQDYKYVKNKP
jgi:hypothetical protein